MDENEPDIQINPSDVFTWIKMNHPDVVAKGVAAVENSERALRDAIKKSRTK